ncbi:Short-chain dehydrogenase/reductase (SDR); putative 3-oxoacyl-[acyl-carrier-protein] reductase / 3-ketoacyl-[acyl-carrier-protein] reductase [Pseudorhizobium banfieldiae]|uniref:Short-chain dehydrogenase/reductase (SDR) putative 3-oxoacyl-[acyl-carrier-protein] reductase / 3-ketoacyl-[acyl-carrier-protein] reductase n=1 Tax=Pseudorhizobium banfieldiae TaxID=1125847 RepID=L0NAN6_9HYPH|nr:SDR family NAD(P)-dependent oxidoreductase [Pseudorhizobium banfieldiae]CAD6598586.1 NAD(P)-dependent oxidoreductase [arsenite-oxidising bacterium NT-25]CAD6603965.1 NAD(P)-dependent oxidoreductase [Rhizobium sp. TCK]CCF17904.1 Short-chain dehydrogenase/reductase (SDR); putative 3-oxoacyl-[acyl-carrier-protein] reductase / 3-ketoacyl-[acyl-carrier-protein] reductase [Pseudorhizobium banfieldiae]
MAGRLQGKIAVVVGAGQQPGTTVGNGRAVAMRFAQEGATCLLIDKVGAWAEDTRSLLDGAQASTFEADVTREDDCRAVIEAAVARYGRVDILHNNVGMSKGDRPTWELEVEAWERIMTLNLQSMFMMCKQALPVMREQRSGSIINISSTSSLSKRPTLAYKTSKGAINTLTQHVAAENAAFGVRANVIVPGLIDTPMAIERRAAETGRSREEIRAERDALVPMGFMGEALDVANAAVFLASDEAKYITGVLLPVDGGLLLKRG